MESLDMNAQPRFEPAEGKIWCGGHQRKPEGEAAISGGLEHNQAEIASLRSQ
jgi:hypothetical protein